MRGVAVNWDQRLIVDQEAMGRWHPRFHLVRPFVGEPRWQGWFKPFRTRLATFQVVLVYREQRKSIPKVWVVKPEVSKRTFPGHPHLNSDGSACTFFVPDGDYDPAADPISTLVDLALDWLQRHVYWTERLIWPGPEAPHDPLGVIQELRGRPNAPCICGSGREFEQCHAKMYRVGARKQKNGDLSRWPGLPDPSVRQVLMKMRRERGPLEMARLFPHLGPPEELLR